MVAAIAPAHWMRPARLLRVAVCCGDGCPGRAGKRVSSGSANERGALGMGKRRQQIMYSAQFAQRLLALWTPRDVALKLRALGGAQLAVDIGGELLSLPLPVVWMPSAAHDSLRLTVYSSLEC